MGMMSEFKDFALKGNVMDLAVGVIIGGAFGTIIASFIDNIVMPLVGLATGGIDFANKFVPLNGQTYATLADAKKAGAAVLAYGSFFTTVINFMILAFVIFMMVRAMNSWKKEAPAAPPAGPTKDQELLGQIRDLLTARKGASA